MDTTAVDLVNSLSGSLVGKHGLYAFLVSITSAMGVLRIVSKPLQGFVDAATVAKVIPQSLLENRWYVFFRFMVDYIASVKLPGKEHVDATPVTPGSQPPAKP